ncbi:hypothetical protein GCM10011519_11690 [Marmoricola endophyticus]|uniref:AGE family epimerase/isomerase n=1 Tax=Marmoricola endophyticus TaxID=2040280 RepID=A0A917BGD1_9ACTN|nr:AGE family epimerase/isomerase [Marmoricola endophyticus]GGF39694.1 hypothetical protein GCM10011519_11690 [Marmoricola endophyticus]
MFPSADHEAWLGEQLRLQLDFGRRFPHPDGGAAWLRSDGTPDLERPVHTWITARMAHVYSLGHLAGIDGCGALADTALAGLTGRLEDGEHGGWFASSEDTTKSAYAHAFVLLAASTALVADRPGARDLLERAAGVLDTRFLTDAGLYAERWDAAWTDLEDYRGVNANMHAVEATLAAYDATGERRFLDRAVHIADTVTGWAGTNDWRVPEHFDTDWQPMLAHHLRQPDHPFEPYGATVGHGLEWSRLLLTVAAAEGGDRTAAATSLFDRAVADGWAVDGHEGFVYTTDWEGSPVVADRMHWVLCEAICAAAALGRSTGDSRYDDLVALWWQDAATHWIDPANGSWAHQLARDLTPSDTVWSGRPDLYHSVHAVLLPRLPLWPTAASVLRNAR